MFLLFTQAFAIGDWKLYDTRIGLILLDKKKILPCAVYLQGEYGLSDLFVGVPAKLGRAGMEQVVEIELTESEKAELEKSAEAVRELVEML